MRNTNTSNGLKVNAISGTYVVLLGFDFPKSKCAGLLGFSILRFDHKEKETYYLEGMKAFAETDPGFPAGSLYSTQKHPIQSFQWADYSAKPGYTYTYTITALKGTPQNLKPVAQTEIEITTESPAGGNQDIYFNRGTAASQEYVRRFGNTRPDDVPNNKAFEWLSRGCYEALENFVTSCKPGINSLKIAAYEFNYEPFLKVLKNVIDKGVDVEIIYDARKADPRKKNEACIKECGLVDNCTPRTEGSSYISHNKFIVKLKKGKPVEVLTGSTNFSKSGIFGHSNVVHVIQLPEVVGKYLEYWNYLKENPKTKPLKNEVEGLTPLPSIPIQPGTTAIFSPRNSLEALNLYSRLAMSAKEGFFMTFAFGINKIFKDVYLNSAAPLRFALLDSATRHMPEGDEKKAELQDVQNLRNMPENIFAIGNFIVTNELDGWVKEGLTGLNTFVRFIHDKFMLVDPLSSSPIVITGSANFSDASTINNDENMVIIKDNTRVADIYLGEYMRLFSHYSYRESLTWQKPGYKPKPLRTDNWWSTNFGNTSQSKRREYFSKDF